MTHDVSSLADGTGLRAHPLIRVEEPDLRTGRWGRARRCGRILAMDPFPLEFPDGFLWGAATAAHQVEGCNVHSDCWAWEAGCCSCLCW